MIRISKRKLSDKILFRLYRLFFAIIFRSRSLESFLAIANDVFTPTEKIMIAKRIGIYYLIIKGIDQKTIADTLKVSTNTVAKFVLVFHDKNTEIVRFMKKIHLKEKVGGFLEDIFTDIFIQPGIKVGHHKLHQEQRRRKIKRKLLNE